MKSTDIPFESATTLAREIRHGRLKSVEVVRSLLDHIDRHNARISAVVTRRDAEAIAEAAAADEAVASGRETGLLHGVPMTVKDAFRVAGVRTSFGLPQYRSYVPGGDCEVVRRLRSAGVVIIGRTNLPLASFDWQCRSPLFGEGRNPWSAERTPGGSSGGAAAAVAAGFSPIELGADLAGSIRYPAHCCGVVGLRTSEGLLPIEDWGPENLPPAFRTVATCGPIARTIEDLDLMMKALGAWSEVESGPAGKLKIAYSTSLLGVEADDATLDLVEQTAGRLSREGHTVVKAAPQGVSSGESFQLWGRLAGHEFRAILPRILQSGFGRAFFEFTFLRWRLGDGPLTDSFGAGLRSTWSEYERALAEREDLLDDGDTFLTDHDLWLLPVSPSEAIPRQRNGRVFRVNGERREYSAYLGSYLCPTALLATPVLTVPIGFSPSGLPIGVQIHAKRGRDSALLEIARRHLSHLVDLRIPPGFDTTP